MRYHIDFKCTIWNRIDGISKKDFDKVINKLKKNRDIDPFDLLDTDLISYKAEPMLDTEKFIPTIENGGQSTTESYKKDSGGVPKKVWDNSTNVKYMETINKIELSSEIAAMKMDMIYTNGEWQNVPEEIDGIITVKDEYQSEFHQYIDEAISLIESCK